MTVARLALVWVLAAALLAGCGTPRAPVVDRTVGSAPAPHTYRVQRGDTLYSVSFSYGLDYRDVAAWNGIAPPYRIYPGQQLRLRPGSSRAARPAPPQARPVPPGTPPRANTSTERPRPPDPAPVRSALRWQWPTQGKVIRSFSANDGGKKGIAIAGRTGQPVRAAADGEVVYSGEGLLRYGKLVIIKHNQTYFSAYAHNRVLLVSEGQQVKGGQPIAQLGRSGTTQPMLHFEIRRDGSPVDPLAYLPR